VFVKGTIGAASPQLQSTNNFPPGYRELADSQVSFATITNGRLKGNVSAASLAATPIPRQFTASGSLPCWENYGATNSFLDLLVVGCLDGWVEVVDAQPDVFETNAPVAGAGPPYKFLVSGNRVASARDKSDVDVDFQTALNASAYSVYFKFTAGRVITFTAPSASPVLMLSNTSSGSFYLAFTNAPAASFTVLSSTNLAVPNANWSAVGPPVQTAPGRFEFTDSIQSDQIQRFYRVRSP
jgi:hypothetical protein